MLSSPAQASATIAQHLPKMPIEDCGIAHAHGRILRAPIVADRPMPAFDRVTMDGYAVKAADWASSPTSPLQVTGFQAAGMIAHSLTTPASVIEIATGAVLSDGADAIVPYEDIEREGDQIRLREGAPCIAGQNIHRCGSDCATGKKLVPTGVMLTGREIAVAASTGNARVQVSARPSIAVIATGDELIDVGTPQIAPHQIRKSNDYAIRAALTQSNLVGHIERFHLRDHRNEIEASLRHILAKFDVVVLTGGVSKGKKDHVPEVLAELGATERLRGIAQRPGKPLWFGTTPRNTPIFALPGNPVSTYTCLHRYVFPALRQMGAANPVTPETVILAAPFTFDRPLAFMLPVKISTQTDGQRVAHPAKFNTSGDLGGLLNTDGFVELPADQTEFSVGHSTELWRWI
ncbi:MAG: molybdopterin molybdotransferase MoeA [Opitutaceae bacterium]|jgi:molybdopterin molybdotransferase|nr:molybdopterin molybdotransferase MoeA [Opitutaceae bacterium]